MRHNCSWSELLRVFGSLRNKKNPKCQKFVCRWKSLFCFLSCISHQTCPAAERPTVLYSVHWHFQQQPVKESFADYCRKSNKNFAHLKPVLMSAGIQWDEPWSCHQVNLRPSVISQRSLSLVFRFTFLNRRVFSPGPALCASPAHECCSPAPHKIQARLRSRPCQVDRPHQGSHGDLGDPPCRFWILQGYLANLRRENYKNVST